MAPQRMKNPPHPGLLIKSDLDGLGINITEAAKALMAWKLSKAFTNSDPEFWLALQAKYDLSQVGEQCADKVRVLWQPSSLDNEDIEVDSSENKVK